MDVLSLNEIRINISSDKTRVVSGLATGMPHYLKLATLSLGRTLMVALVARKSFKADEIR